MTYCSRTIQSLTIGLAILAILAIGASAATATPMTHQERQAIAARGQGAPTPPVHVDARPGARLAMGGRLAVASTPTAGSSDDGPNWVAIGAFAAAALAACAAMLAVGRRHTPATPAR